jgi:hypothetical protein
MGESLVGPGEIARTQQKNLLAKKRYPENSPPEYPSETNRSPRRLIEKPTVTNPIT